MENRRKAPRVPLITIARITPHGLQSTSDAYVRDISTGGIGIYVKGRYQVGDILLVKVSIKADDGGIIKESLTGRVAWVRPLEEGHCAVGIEVAHMEQKHPKLHAYVKQQEEAL